MYCTHRCTTSSTSSALGTTSRYFQDKILIPRNIWLKFHYKISRARFIFRRFTLSCLTKLTRIWKRLFKETWQVLNAEIECKSDAEESTFQFNLTFSEMAPGLKVLGVRVTKPKIPEAIRWLVSLNRKAIIHQKINSGRITNWWKQRKLNWWSQLKGKR